MFHLTFSHTHRFYYKKRGELHQTLPLAFLLRKKGFASAFLRVSFEPHGRDKSPTRGREKGTFSQKK